MAKYKLSDIFQGDYPVSQRYGQNPDYYKQFGLAGHEGVDYATPVGVTILCPFEEGVVLRDVDDPKSGAYGEYVVVWDKVQKCAVWYCHLSQNNVTVGQVVKRGQALGSTGNTGNSSGPHLHANFVETDDQGNRLNMSNGYQGFLNILDPNLVEWIPINSSPTPPMDDYKKLYKDEKKAHELDNKNKDTEIEALRKTIATQQIALEGHDADCKLKVQAGKDETTAHLLIDFDKKEKDLRNRIKELEAQATTPAPAPEKPLELRYKGKSWAVKLDAVLDIIKA